MNQNIIVILLIIAVGFVIYQAMNPKIEIETEYLPGEPVHDTVTVTKDSIVYLDRWNTITDTIWRDSSGLVHASSEFVLQDSVVTGTVLFDEPAFSFKDVRIKQKIIKESIVTTRIDTLKSIRTIRSGFHHGIMAGFGYGLINKEFDVFVGYGFTYDFQ